MNRVIKFRAFDGKKMIEPYSVRDGKAFIIKRCSRDDKVLRDDDGVNYYCNWDIDVATNYPLMQFTGHLDFKGSQLFEGDIVEQYHFTDFSGKVHTILHRVVWSEKYDGWLCLNCKSNDENDGSCQLWVYSKHPFAIVGNIYQNPELLQTT